MNRKRNRSVLRVPAFLLLLLILCLLGRRIAQYVQSRAEYAGIREQAVFPFPEETDDGGSGDGPGAGAASGKAERFPDDALRIDWDALAEMEIRPAAWLKIGEISYPVMQAKDNEYYLHRLPDGTPNPGGSLFLQAENAPDLTDRHSIIYGHNMADGSMFGKLKQFADEKYAGMKFDLYLPDGSLHRYRLFAVLTAEGGSDAFTIRFSGDDEFLRYQRKELEKSLFDSPEKLPAEKRLVTLATCSGPQGTRLRLLVQGAEEHVWREEGRAVRTQEKGQDGQ